MHTPVAILALTAGYALLWALVDRLLRRALAWPADQRSLLMDLLYYLYVVPAVLAALLLSPDRFQWADNGDDLLLVVFMATPGFFAFRAIEALPLHSGAATTAMSTVSPASILVHHVGFLAVLLAGLLAGFFPYLFLWLSLQQSTGITYAIYGLRRARGRPTYAVGLVHFAHFVFVRVFFVGAGLLVAIGVAISRRSEPSVFWHLIAPLGFALNLGLNLGWLKGSLRLLRPPATG